MFESTTYEMRKIIQIYYVPILVIDAEDTATVVTACTCDEVLEADVVDIDEETFGMKVDCTGSVTFEAWATCEIGVHKVDFCLLICDEPIDDAPGIVF